ncbi:unnamed protein product [Triticum turgidum subsp. durum]|uniref:peroxidase n=1 Tax=Triticum turgidum subsp. durum TaxID=4567 RepID=A0A9R0R182_TRITD|nr:unnamed protein product [Triticum turgidum subsp. durum]
MAAASLKLSVALACVLLLSSSACHGLEVGYYKKTCPRVEAIVRDEVKKFVYKNAGIGAGLIRMFFHDCFVQGCDGSVLLDPTPANPQPEKLSPPNFPSLRGFEALDNLPPPFFNLDQLVASFAAKGLSAKDMVVLSGAHTIGVSHCSSFVSDRIAVTSDIDGGFANFLRRRCPANPSTANDPTVNQDVVTPNALDNQYYKNVLAHKVLFTSDAALLTTPATTQMVRDSANIPGQWEAKFNKAMVKMGAIDVKTGKQGEIRRKCRVVNH